MTMSQENHLAPVPDLQNKALMAVLGALPMKWGQVPGDFLAKATQHLIVLALCAASWPAYAVFDIQATVGKRWYQWEGLDADGVVATHGVQSQEVQVSAHLAPIPFIPIGFGALVNVGSPNKDDLAYLGNVTDAKIFQTAVDVTAWLTVMPVLTPFVRVTYPLYSAVAIKYKRDDEGNIAQLEYAETGKLTGYHLDLGAKIGVLPFVSLMVEGGMASETYKQDDLKSNGVTIDGDKSRSAPSKSFSVGLEVGI